MRAQREAQQEQVSYEKKKKCRFYMEGKCKFSNQCRYSHDFIKCYLFRHAESHFNQLLNSFGQSGNSSEAKQKFQMDSSLIDCGITERGVSQINSITFPSEIEKLKLKFDLIFVSPLERCLKTTERCIQRHKIKSKKVIVLASLTQVVSKICDFSRSLEEKKNKYQNFDFSNIKNNQTQFWQDQFIDPEFTQKIEKNVKNGERYLKILNDIFPQPLESSKRCFARTLLALQEIKSICANQKASTILIISHNRVLKYIMGRQREGRSSSLENCEMKLTLL